ncbi:diguanylate cyclase domain-containing protein [Bacillus sp. V5-8f]|uniref:diguanylate cyclase domain-containing protein n=1 Tax=Bacillus sp. V5-8f TaxID=2053044 RepID=UPI000C75F049|nr:GGDEF domain-containing protein [Bacillus sp. V5-8f]PLT34519.1 hypothetical protein CUU64_09910 [Bacillus sp. V5-8f]
MLLCSLRYILQESLALAASMAAFKLTCLFVCLFGNVSNYPDNILNGSPTVKHTAQRIINALKEPFHFGGNEVYVTASIGISIYPGDGNDSETLIKDADAAMYKIKESGRNNV